VEDGGGFVGAKDCKPCVFLEPSLQGGRAGGESLSSFTCSRLILRRYRGMGSWYWDRILGEFRYRSRLN
jgi:hypothetical protein